MQLVVKITSGKNDDFVPQSMIFSLEQWKYHFFTQKFVEMPHLCMKGDADANLAGNVSKDWSVSEKGKK